MFYTDTDSLIYYFIVPNIHDFMKRDIHKFDASDYPLENVYGLTLVNKKVLDLMKDGSNGKIIREFFGLRSTLHSYRIFNKNTEKKKVKGVKGSTLRKIHFDNYEKCLFTMQNLIE